MISPSTIPTFTFDSNGNTTINQMASLSFIFTTYQFIPAGAILELIFPNDLAINQSSLNSIVGVANIQPVVSYTISGQSVLMSNAITVYYLNTLVHYFTVSSIQNPVNKYFLILDFGKANCDI